MFGNSCRVVFSVFQDEAAFYLSAFNVQTDALYAWAGILANIAFLLVCTIISSVRDRSG